MSRKYIIYSLLAIVFALAYLGGYIVAPGQALAATRSSATRSSNSRDQAAAATVVDDTVFTDIANHWAESSVTRLYSLDLVEGYPDQTYKPDTLLNKLETVVLILRAGGFSAEAAKLQSQLDKQAPKDGQSSSGRTSTDRSSSRSSATTAPAPAATVQIEDRKTPLVPWGQAFIDLAFEKGFLQVNNPATYDYSAPASRMEVAELLARAMYLLPPDYNSGSVQENLTFSANMATSDFSDLGGLSATERTVIAAITNAGVMSGYPDGTFRPYNNLTRAEVASILSRLVDQNWVKVSADRRLLGWISRIAINKNTYELTLTNLTGDKVVKVSPKVKCFRNGVSENLVQAKNYRCEVVLNAKKEAGWVQIIEPKSVGSGSNMRASVKMVMLGEENYILVSDMNVVDQKLPLAWDAVITGSKSSKGFSTLKAGDFVDLHLENGEVKSAEPLVTKKKSGKVDHIQGTRLYLVASANAWPAWFNYYDRARIVDKDGIYMEDVRDGDSIEVTYIDPNPNEIDDEIVVEIKVNRKTK